MSPSSIFSFLLCFCAGFTHLSSQSVDSLVAATVARAEQLRIEEDQPAAAMRLLGQTLKELEQQTGHPPLALVPLYHKLGVNYYYQGNYERAEIYAGKALDIRLAALGKTNLAVARSFFLRGAIYRKLQSYDAAAVDIKQAIGSMESLLTEGLSNDTLRLINMYDEFIDLCAFTGNHARALPYWERSYRYYQKDPKRFAPNLADLAVTKSRIFDNQQRFAAAADQLKRAVSLYRELYLEDERYAIQLAGAHSSLAYVANKQGHHRKAIEGYQEALDLLQVLVTRDDTPYVRQELGRVYNNLLKLYGITEDYAKAVSCFEESLNYLRQGWDNKMHPEIAELFRDRAEVEVSRQQLSAALSFNSQSLQVLLPDFGGELAEPVRLPEPLLTDRMSLVQTLDQRAKLLMEFTAQSATKPELVEVAFSHYQSIDTIITQIRQRFQGSDSRYELIAASVPLYEQAIATALTAHEQSGNEQYLEAAFHFAARNKALVLLSDFRGREALELVAIPNAISERELLLKRQVFQLEDELSSPNAEIMAEEEKREAKEQLFNLHRAHQKLIDSLEEIYPEYQQVKYGIEASASSTNLRAQLADDEALLEYFVGSNELYIFCLTSRELSYHRLPLPAEFTTTIDSVITDLQTPGQASPGFADRTNQLYQWLLPAEIQAQLTSAITKLVIIPDGMLLPLPFDILITDDQQPAYLLERFNLSYAYSSQLLQHKNRRVQAPQSFAGFGLEYDDYTLAAINSSTADSLMAFPPNRALGKLHYSEDEVQEIARLLGGEQWLNVGATRANFEQHAEDYAILHLATHSILDEEYPLNSALVFHKTSDTTEFLLRAADLYQLNLRAELVVLSACDTGAGKLRRGEGVRSLARAFAAAGCTSTVASLWSASDKSTRDILVDFYTYLQDGLSKDEALREAKLNYLNEAPPAYASPFYWAHLVVVGDTAPLVTLSSAKVSAWYGLIAVLLVGVVIAILYKLFR